MIHARLPERLTALHAFVAHERIHDGVLERMPHVQSTGHIRRRNHDAIGLAIALRGEVTAFFPAGVSALFNFKWVVGLVHRLLG